VHLRLRGGWLIRLKLSNRDANDRRVHRLILPCLLFRALRYPPVTQQPSSSQLTNLIDCKDPPARHIQHQSSYHMLGCRPQPAGEERRLPLVGIPAAATRSEPRRGRAKTVRQRPSETWGCLRRATKWTVGPPLSGDMIAFESSVHNRGSNFEHQVRSSRRPTHLLLRVHSPMQQPLYRALRDCRGDRFAASPSGTALVQGGRRGGTSLHVQDASRDAN
jgi:hypothetical protein